MEEKGGGGVPRGRIATTDLFKGAYFLCSGCDLEKIVFGGGRSEIAEFWIIGLKLPELERDYRTGKARVNPMEFRESLNNLRDELFKAKKERDGAKR